MVEQRSNIRKFYYVMGVGYALRIPIQFLYGSYYVFVKEWYWRWVLYLVSNPVFELPTIFFCFVMHYRSFNLNVNDVSVLTSD